MARVLRVALIHASRIIEDRTFPAGARVTIGTSPRCTILVPNEDFPASFTLFDGQTLRWPEGATGRLALSGEERPLAEFSSAGLALPHTARGRLAIGPMSVVFHFVEPAPALPKPELPRALRGRLLAQIDRAFLGVLAASLLANFAGAGWLYSQPTPPDDEVRMENEDRAPDRFARAHLPLPAAPREPTAPPAADPPKSKPGPSLAAAPAAGRGSAPRAPMGLLAVIGAAGEGHSGLDDVLGSASSVTDVATALAGATTVRVATVADDRLHGAAAGRTATVGPLDTGLVHEVTLAEAKAAMVHGRANPEAPVLEQHPGLDSAALTRWVHSRTSAIQSCYEHELKRNHALHGRVLLRFAVTPRGRTANVDIAEDTLGNPEVGACIASLVKHWVLPFTPEDEVTVAFPWVFVPAT